MSAGVKINSINATVGNNNNNNSNHSNYTRTSQTFEHIYEAHRRRQLESKIRSKPILLASSLLAISSIAAIGLLQYFEYIAYIDDDQQGYIQKSKSLCGYIDVAQIDLISSPTAIALILLYILLYKRRVFLRNKFRYRNVGLPMMVSCLNKTDRLFSAFTYGLIAFSVYNIVRYSIGSNASVNKLVQVKDPTGIISLLYSVLQMFLLGIRYYPVLVAYRANTFIIDVTCAIYMWIDYTFNIYQYGSCETLANEKDSKEEISRKLGFYIAYKVLSAIPLSFFSAFITVTLTCKAIINLHDFMRRRRSNNGRTFLERKSRDSIFCLIANVDDDHEIIYSSCDFEYVLQLLENTKKSNNNKKSPESERSSVNIESIEIETNNSCKPASWFVRIRNTSIARVKCEFMNFIKKFIYPHDCSFRFTSRYCNTITVALVALYYIFLFWTYLMSITWAPYIYNIILPKVELSNNENNSSSLSLSSFLSTSTLIEFICLWKTEFCKEELAIMARSVFSVFFAPLFVALFISLFQVFLLVKETRQHLIEMYKGKCEFVKKLTNLDKGFIASSSFHFGGYLVGYLIWGFVIIYMVGVILGILFILLRFLFGFKIFWTILLKLVPVTTALVSKMIINYIASNYIFLRRDSKLLALNNFRAFNVFLYFNFYLDCFMGIISAISRLIKAVIVAVIMMPRLSYSFMGRHFEQFDAGYSCYAGFLHMEAMHTNPIIICFCSLLYYREYLTENLQRYKEQRKKLKNPPHSNLSAFPQHHKMINLDKFTNNNKSRVSSLVAATDEAIISVNDGKMNSETMANDDNKHNKRTYKTRVLVRWHLLLRMYFNPEIIKYRRFKRAINNNKSKTTSQNEQIKDHLVLGQSTAVNWVTRIGTPKFHKETVDLKRINENDDVDTFYEAF